MDHQNIDIGDKVCNVKHVCDVYLGDGLSLATEAL